MSGTDTRTSTRERRAEALRVFVLVAFCVLLYFTILDARPLWNIDEGMHSATSKEMVRTGDWVTPRHNGEPFYDKPALHNWFVAASFLVFGFTEAAARLPAALLGLATVLLTYWMGRRIYGPWAGFFAGVVLASAGTFIVLSQSIVHDQSLMFFVTAALATFHRGYSAREGRAKWFFLSYVALGLSMLAKGPIGLLLPGGVIFFFLVFRRDLRFLGRMGLHWGVPLGLLVAVPWYAAIAAVNRDYLYEFVVRLHLGSFLDLEDIRVTHPRPWYFYIGALFGGFAPWSAFLPGAVWRAWQRRREDEGGATTLLFVWGALYVLFFSAAESKLSTYILPMFPAAALLTGRLWAEVALRDVPAATALRGIRWPILVYTLFPIAVVIFLAGEKTSPASLWENYRINVGIGWIPLAALYGFLVLAAVLVWRGRSRLAFAAVAASVSTCLWLTVLLVVPGQNPVRSSRDVSLEMDRRLPPGAPLIHYHRLQDTALFYTERRVNQVRYKRPLRALLAGDERVYILISEERYGKLGLTEPILMRDGKDLLISNREDP